MMRLERTTCRKGHPYATTRAGWKYCPVCRRENAQRPRQPRRPQPSRDPDPPAPTPPETREDLAQAAARARASYQEALQRAWRGTIEAWEVIRLRCAWTAAESAVVEARRGEPKAMEGLFGLRVRS